MPARSAPDLQCIIAGYSMVSNIFFAATTVSCFGASLDEIGKFINLRPSFLQAFFSKKYDEQFLSPLKFITVLSCLLFLSFFNCHQNG